MIDEFSMRATKGKLIVILGPTAVGKTELSLRLAKVLDTEIISGDSMLVYRGFDIGTAKPSKEERCIVPHSLIDILNPEDEFNVMKFNRLATERIALCHKRGQIPILAGGTGLYIQSLLEGYTFNTTEEDSLYRKSLERLAEIHGKEYIHEMLEKIDPISAARLHVNDFRRVIRALEVWYGAGEKISQSKAAQSGETVYDVFVIGLIRERQALYDRINARVDKMIDEGLETEVRNLLSSGVSPNAQAMKGIGYRQMIEYIQGKRNWGDTVSLIKKLTRNFAKRQITWYRRLPYICWYEADTVTDEQLSTAVLTDMQEFLSVPS